MKAEKKISAKQGLQIFFSKVEEEGESRQKVDPYLEIPGLLSVLPRFSEITVYQKRSGRLSLTSSNS
jgi:hypothetical protein